MFTSIEPAGARILLIDDTDATRYATQRILSAAGALVIEAMDGASGIERSSGVDLIILDVNLPDIDGFEVCRRLRARSDTRYTPIMHLSATYLDEGNKLLGLRSGSDAYVVQPIDPEMLIATVNTLLRARRAEESSRKYSRLLATVFGTAGVGIAVVDAQDILIEANPTLCAMMQRDHFDIVGADFSRLLFDDRRRIETAATASDATLALRRPDGTILECEYRVAQAGTGDRVIVLTDASARASHARERQRLLEAESSARAEAERANLMKDDFLAVLSHELRNPLSNVLGWSNVLQRESNADARQEAMQAIERNIQLQVKLIDDLLDVSRIAAGKLKLEKRLVDARDIVRGVVHSMWQSAQARDIKMSVIAVEPLIVDADPARLQQICSNLLSNAIKFSRDAGSISIVLERVDDSAVMTVEDDGIGIAPDFLPQIFDRFRQGDASTTRRTSGLGLGLAIVQSLVKLHDGDVRASSEGLGKGAGFRVSLPIVKTAALPRRIEPLIALNEAKPLLGRRVLLVDDNPEARVVLRYALAQWGADVSDFGSAGEVLAAIDEHIPAFIISDIGMPDVDGYSLIAQVRARGYTPAMAPALALTAFARDTDVRRMMESGFQGHVAKPVSLDDLLRAIQCIPAPSI